MRFDCAVGCGASGSSASNSVSGGLVPPDGWISIGYSVARSDPPYSSADLQYSAIVCSTDCAYAFLARQKREMAYSVGFKRFGAPTFMREETRADVARRIGELVLEAIDEMPEDQTLILPLQAEQFNLQHGVVLAFHQLLAEDAVNE